MTREESGRNLFCRPVHLAWAYSNLFSLLMSEKSGKSGKTIILLLYIIFTSCCHINEGDVDNR